MIRVLLIALAVALLVVPIARAMDLPDKAADEKPKGEEDAIIVSVTREPDPKPGDVCDGLTDAARDSRLAWQVQTLNELNAKVETRLKELETKRAEYQQWLKQREAMLRGAEQNLVDIYSRMKAESASAQLAKINEYTAAGVLMKLNPRVSSTILNEMEPERAAQLAMIMVGLTNRQRRPAQQQAQPTPAAGQAAPATPAQPPPAGAQP